MRWENLQGEVSWEQRVCGVIHLARLYKRSKYGDKRRYLE